MNLQIDAWEHVSTVFQLNSDDLQAQRTWRRFSAKIKLIYT